MGKEYFLTNRKIKFRVERGIIKFVGGIRDHWNVKYINEKKGFGNLHLTYEGKGGTKKWEPLMSECYKDGEPIRRGRHLVYKGEVKGEELTVSLEYILHEDWLQQKIVVTNHTDGPIVLKDFGQCYSCHTDFKWGNKAAKEVIGHYFVAGNGSHATYYRCDGNGEILTILPSDGSEWIYYDCVEEDGKEVQDQASTILYSLSDSASSKAVEAGSKLRMPSKAYKLAPGERYEYSCRYLLAKDYDDCRKQLINNGQVVVESIPGYTVPEDLKVQLCLRSQDIKLHLTSDKEDTDIRSEKQKEGISYYTIKFHSWGEHCICVHYGDASMYLYYFVTQSIETLIKKRASFIAAKQFTDENKWYRGLFAEWNNETGVMLGPDNYDKIEGWRIYEVTCDDPGLSKPAFLSSKQTIYPIQKEIDALDTYIEHFVWGGLQQTEEEAYPYGIYGIPDWYTLRNSKEVGNAGKTHLWRIYDYSHIALLYYNMYEVAAYQTKVYTKLPTKVYLRRAYGTALAMFQIPEELEGWSAYKTGLYNELIIPKIIRALKEVNWDFEASRLERHWKRKIRYFVKECTDIFGSEYPFDTTGFETTHILAKEALEFASMEKDDSSWSGNIPYEQAIEFMENQIACNIACRGMLEPAYFWYGSDYRGNNMKYLLSYMSQMGGCSLLDYACYYAKEPLSVLRLAYGSLLSSWALVNSGDAKSNYGYWFPGKEHDGCAGGGFEPLYLGKTWLGQPHTGGSWYYSCEIDLGFCGGIRGMATVLACDPIFDMSCYGGILEEQEKEWQIHSRDGIRRRFHYIDVDAKFHIVLEKGQFAESRSVIVDKEINTVEMNLEASERPISVSILVENLGDYVVQGQETQITNQKECKFEIPEGSTKIKLIRIGEGWKNND